MMHGLSTACIVTLALGIGANTTIYSFADAVLFRLIDVPAAVHRWAHVYLKAVSSPIRIATAPRSSPSSTRCWRAGCHRIDQPWA